MPAIDMTTQCTTACLAALAMRVRVADCAVGRATWPVQWPHQYELPVPHS